ncbi:hypothetical protein, partial [Parabacteroides distasonis]|uniref:hypothetical protein n=1 Tax=Parabacteroides distasonis TaxID=823 RepID=UPI00232E4B4A
RQFEKCYQSKHLLKEDLRYLLSLIYEFSRLCRMKVCKQTDPEKGLTPVNRNVKDLRMAR